MKWHKGVLINIITAVLLSCSSVTNSAKPSSFPKLDIEGDIQKGKYLVIVAPNGWNSFKTNEPITLDIVNISDNQITTGSDFEARIFVYTDNGWVEVKNKESYEYEVLTLDPAEGYDPLKSVATVIFPELPDYSVTSYIRILVFGNLIENGQKTKRVGSYIDLELHP